MVDPFAGGGSIPLEALRLGCEAFASDLNPVACLILKVMLEDIPRHGPEWADQLRRVGAEIQAAAENELAEFYPSDPDGARPIAYLWARTVRCESPNCGAEIPLLSSLWLCKKPGRRWALRYRPTQAGASAPQGHLEIFQPTNESEVAPGTVKQARATCPCCSVTLPTDRLRAQLSQQHGGCNPVLDLGGKRIGGAMLVAVVTIAPSGRGRAYRLPTEADYVPFAAASKRLGSLPTATANGLSTIPDEPVNPTRPSPNARGLSAVTRYGVETFGDLFNSREKLALVAIGNAVAEMHERVPPRDRGLVEAVATAVSKRADYGSSLTRWHLTFEKTTCTFSKQALSQTYDFVEPIPMGNTSGAFGAALDSIYSACSTVAAAIAPGLFGQVQLADAALSPLSDESAGVWFTDPPYYDAIPYADISDYFYVWLRRSLPGHPLLRDPFDPSSPLTPKLKECVWNQSYQIGGRPKSGAFFEAKVADCFRESRRTLEPSGVGCVVFAHKTTEGWEALLSGMSSAGWVITASWPVATERGQRLQSQGSAALATSVHLVCRPRPEDAPVGDWADVLRELPRKVGDWMEHLQSEGVRGADLVFACIGPALEIYSRHSRVETAEGHEVPLGGDPEARAPEDRGFLAYVWETIGRSALEQILGTAEAKARNGAAGALEEDARLTALFLWTLQSTASGEGSEAVDGTDDTEADNEEDDEDGGTRSRAKGFSLAYDVARRFAQPLGIHLDEWEDRIIKTEKGVVRLLPVSERAKQLFGEDGAQAVAHQIETDAAVAANPQITLFPDEAPTVRGRRRTHAHAGATVSDHDLQTTREATTLDRIHAAMLLQAGGRTNALRALLRAEVDRGPDFVRLANALSALYPMGCEEKRLLDAMLLAVPR